MFDDIYKTLDGNVQGLYKEKGSKFIALAFPVATEENVKQLLLNIKKEYFDARHHCYAYILGYNKSAYRINDDGEPSGTAGKPIYGQLLSYDLTNVLLVVVRYFGGTKLGVSGLIKAYKTAAKDALENATIVEKNVYSIYRIDFEYAQMNDVMQIMKDNDLEQSNCHFDLNCSIEFSVRCSRSDKVCNAFNKIQGVKLTYLRNS